VPTNPVAVAVALADKLDTLVGFWAIDEKPTGSKDPFALRRAALGVVRIILENDLRIPLSRVILVDSTTSILPELDKVNVSKVIKSLKGSVREGAIDLKEFAEISKKKIDSAFEDTKKENDELFDNAVKLTLDLLAFVADRLKVYLRDKGIRHDLIDAIFALGEDDLIAIVNRVEALQSFLDTADGENLLAGYKRAANILKAEAKKGDLPSGDIGTLSQSEARDLQQGLSKATGEIEAALAEESYSTAMTALSELRGPIDAFFENVMVVSEVKTERENNLRLLGLIRDTARQIADFDAIGG